MQRFIMEVTGQELYSLNDLNASIAFGEINSDQ